ncbi:hypothetical protein [Stagnihabitans tardus]|uniref:Lysozyme inhibitor LprI N-terminal domain-containing protein n=1 Tax=Stagnihabitans tardus TaxID=2699202 RepID=A0AAE4YDL8_9RHOB|nr:hypothetical protein [Stagnihabitans tardus]NBZ87675.1 hypothetical protein [Stagnihabitans tardus]
MANALCWQAGLIFLAQAAHADCAAPEGDFQATICADPGLRAKAEAIWTTATETLAQNRNPWVALGLRRSIRHQLDAYGNAWDYAKAQPEDSGACDDEPSSCAETWFTKDWLAERLERLSSFAADPSNLALLREEMRFRRKFTGGPFGHDDANCGLLEPWVLERPYEDLHCAGTFRIQHHDRVCTAEVTWASGHYMTDLRVDQIVAGQPVLKGRCSILDQGGWGSEPFCPEMSIDAPQVGWTTAPDDFSDPLVARPDLDPMDPGETDVVAMAMLGPDGLPGGFAPPLTDWFQTCLTTPDYPPPDQVRE